MSQRWGDWPWFSGQDLQPQRGRDPALPTWFTLSINQGVQLGALLASETNRFCLVTPVLSGSPVVPPQQTE